MAEQRAGMEKKGCQVAIPTLVRWLFSLSVAFDASSIDGCFRALRRGGYMLACRAGWRGEPLVATRVFLVVLNICKLIYIVDADIPAFHVSTVGSLFLRN